jgi:uncharacterized membrane protein YphA (DoxX/SURF4 family)
LAVIGLRLTIGFHFFSEGLDKLMEPKPFTGYFLASAKGPLAPTMKSYIWDPDGLIRLGYQPQESGYPRVRMEPTVEYWKQYVAQAIQHHGFDDKQQARAEEILREHLARLKWFENAYGEDLVEYFRGIERRNRQLADPGIQRVASLRGQSEKWQADLKGMAAPLLRQVEGLWASLEREVNGLAGPGTKPLRIGKLGRTMFDSEWIDGFIPWFDVTIGICLILGLFTWLAGLAGAGFLAMVIASQWPGATGAIATWPQAIEMFALLTLVGVRAGQYGGLDFFLRALCAKCCPASRGNQ